MFLEITFYDLILLFICVLSLFGPVFSILSSWISERNFVQFNIGRLHNHLQPLDIMDGADYALTFNILH